ncbi:unnamed protein product, partial [Ectocarpus sp. 4 AP-2014]
VTQLLVRERRLQQLGPLVNEFLIDVFSCIEDQRLAFHAHNQDKYRTSLHHNSALSRIPRSLATTSAPADRVIIPSSFSGGFADPHDNPLRMITYSTRAAVCNIHQTSTPQEVVRWRSIDVPTTFSEASGMS